MTFEQNNTTERLLLIAESGTGQSCRVAEFLLAWWNSEECGAFTLRPFWGLHDDITADLVIVFAFIARNKTYPDALGFGRRFKSLVRQWRPQLQAA